MTRFATILFFMVATISTVLGVIVCPDEAIQQCKTAKQLYADWKKLELGTSYMSAKHPGIKDAMSAKVSEAEQQFVHAYEAAKTQLSEDILRLFASAGNSRQVVNDYDTGAGPRNPQQGTNIVVRMTRENANIAERCLATIHKVCNNIMDVEGKKIKVAKKTETAIQNEITKGEGILKKLAAKIKGTATKVGNGIKDSVTGRTRRRGGN